MENVDIRRWPHSSPLHSASLPYNFGSLTPQSLETELATEASAHVREASNQ